VRKKHLDVRKGGRGRGETLKGLEKTELGGEKRV